MTRIPAKRWGNPDDFKGPVIYLASSASNYVNGEIMAVDGGWLGKEHTKEDIREEKIILIVWLLLLNTFAMELRSLMRRRRSSKDIIILMNGGLKRFIQYTRAGGISGTEQWSNKDSKTSKLSIAATITSSRWSNLRLLRETPFPPGFLWLSSSSSRSGCICKCKWGSLRVSTTITMLLHCRGRRRLTDHAAVTADPAE